MIKLQKNILLAPYTTFRIGGPAKYFFVAKNKEKLLEAVKWARKKSLPFFILGGGSNVLVSDKGFEGLVIKLEVKSYKLEKDKIYAGASIKLSVLIERSAKASLTGLEWAVGIPGTVGGAIRGNAGAFGHSISESVKNIEALKINSKLTPKQSLRHATEQAIKQFNHNECQFVYRGSIFKKEALIVLSVFLKLKKDKLEKIKERAQQYLDLRNKHLSDYPSAGSIFKNIILKEQSLEVQKMISSEKIKNGKVPAGYLIEQCGLKGRQIGQAQISDKHANFIVNLGGAKAKDVKGLISLAKKEVKNKFMVELEEEIIHL